MAAKTPIWKKWWAWLIAIVVIGGISSATKDKEATKDSIVSSETSAVADTTKQIPRATPEMQKEWGGLTFEQFTDKFYALSPADQTKTWDSGMVEIQVTWEGIAIDSKFFVRADKYQKGMEWAGLKDELRAYVVSARGYEKDLIPGEKVKLTGKIKSRGTYNKEANGYAQWRLEK